MPGPSLVEVLDVARHVVLEPRAHLLAEGDVLGGVRQIHWRGPPHVGQAGWVSSGFLSAGVSKR